jgi:hypothetical protein
VILKIGKGYNSPCKICGFRDCMHDAVGVAVYLPLNEEFGYRKLRRRASEARD